MTHMTGSGSPRIPGVTPAPGRGLRAGLVVRFELLGWSLILLLGSAVAFGLLMLWSLAVGLVPLGGGLPVTLLATVLVRRFADPSDARASTLSITPHGQDALQRIRAETTLMLTASLDLLTPDQRSALAAALPVLERRAEAQPTAGNGNSLPVLCLLAISLLAIGLLALCLLMLGQAAGEFIAFPSHLGEPLFELDDAADSLQGDALSGHADDLLDDPDLVPRIAALAAGRPLRRDNLQLVHAAQERLLDREHLRDLADREERRVLVFQR